ncbi:TPM domain-containing protein [candidate division KSB1 bacterium]|nr:TPM domain-containing protein [candidate division KSB1 bacterium]
MDQILSDHERSRFDGLIVQAEKRTDTQIVLAVIKRSDSYTELPWKAFALGASVAGLLIFILGFPFYDWSSRVLAPIAVTVTLAGGAVFALLTVFFPGFAKRFLSAHRAEMEVQQYAESLFLARELFATSRRTGVLMLISLFERQVILLPDTGLNDRLNADTMQNIIVKMTSFLKRNETNQALEAGLERLSGILETGAQESGENELSNEIIEKNGI